MAAGRAGRVCVLIGGVSPRSGGLATGERRRRCSTGSIATGRRARHERASGEWAQDRPSTPHRQPGRVSEAVHDRVCEARERTGWGPRLIASELGMAHATVSRCLERRGLSRLPRPPREQVRRFEWPCPGDLLQMDTKRLARFTRPGHASPAIATAPAPRSACGSAGSSATRSSTTTPGWPTPRSTPTSAPPPSPRFVERALAFFAGHGITRAAAANRQRVDLHPQPLAARAVSRTGIDGDRVSWFPSINGG